MKRVLYIYGRVVLFVLAIIELQYSGLINGFLDQFPSSKIGSIRDAVIAFCLSFIGFGMCEKPVAEIWNKISPINRPTYWETQLVFGFAIASGSTLLCYLWQWQDVVALLWLGPLLFIAAFPAMVWGWIWLRIFTQNKLPDQEKVAGDQGPTKDPYVMNKVLSYVIAALVFTIITTASIFAISAYLGNSIGSDGWKSIAQCSIFTTFFLIFFGRHIVGLGKGILNVFRLNRFGSERRLMAFSYFIGYMSILTLVVLLLAFSGLMKVQSLWAYGLAYGLIGTSALLAGIVFGRLRVPQGF